MVVASGPGALAILALGDLGLELGVVLPVAPQLDELDLLHQLGGRAVVCGRRGRVTRSFAALYRESF